MKVEGLESLTSKLRKAADRAESASVIVGYQTAYAVYIHEMPDPKTLGKNVPRPSGLGEYWGPSQYGPKFLERPARGLARELGRMVRVVYKATKNLQQSLVVAGMRLQRESMQQVLVEYGILRASAFTLPENQ